MSAILSDTAIAAGNVTVRLVGSETVTWEIPTDENGAWSLQVPVTSENPGSYYEVFAPLRAGGRVRYVGTIPDADDGKAISPGSLAAISAPCNGEAPVGGSTDQVLLKNSGDDYDYDWATVDEDFIHCDAYGHGLTTLHAILADIDSRLTALETPAP